MKIKHLPRTKKSKGYWVWNRTHLLRSHTHFLAHPSSQLVRKQGKGKLSVSFIIQANWSDWIYRNWLEWSLELWPMTRPALFCRSPLLFISLGCCNNDSCTSHFLSRCWRNLFKCLLPTSRSVSILDFIKALLYSLSKPETLQSQ